MSFNHQIYVIKLPNNQESPIAHQKVNAMFNDASKRWFDYTIIKRYPLATKIYDRSLAGYHWEIGSWIFELR